MVGGGSWKSLELEGVRVVAVISHPSPSVLLPIGVPSAPRDSFLSKRGTAMPSAPLSSDHAGIPRTPCFLEKHQAWHQREGRGQSPNVQHSCPSPSHLHASQHPRQAEGKPWPFPASTADLGTPDSLEVMPLFPGVLGASWACGLH